MLARPTPQIRSRTVLAVATWVGLVCAGCSDNTLELDPQIDVSLDGIPNRTVHEFQPDTTGGQLQQEATVRIVNSGEGSLVLSAIDFASQNKFIKDVWPAGKPTFPRSLAPNESLTIKVQFKPSAGEEDNNGAILTIKHNDRRVPSDVVLSFKVKAQGAVLVVEPSALVFVNPSKANPPSQCVKIGNAGNAPLVFKKAYFGTATPYYTITKGPNEGDSIPALGEGNNPKTNPMRIDLCVRLSPEAKDADYATKLVIETNDTSTPQKVVPINAKWEEDNKYTVTCSSPDGKLKYDFSGVNAGAAERCCNVFNEGPSGFLINAVDVKALVETRQDVAAAVYSTTLYSKTATGEKEAVKLPRSISAGKSLEFCVTYTYPSDGKTTNAETIIRFTQANQPDALQIPIIAGTCETPNLILAPVASPIWLTAKVNGKASGQLIVANQSCAPLQLVQACVSQSSVTGSPCSNANLLSTHFKLTPEVSLTSVAPWGLLSLPLTFEPQDNKYVDIQHFLHIVYCPGVWDGQKCADPLVSTAVPVIGYIGDEITPPSLTLAMVSTSAPKVGQPFKIEATATSTGWPIGLYGAYAWFIAKRPEGSILWLSTEFQATDAPWVSIKPDVAGKYTIIGAAQAVDEADPTSYAWSPQVAIEVNVAE